MRVIQLKISPPPVGGTVVRRPRIESLLSRLIEQHRVVCVLASAGAGKTTAVLQAAQQLRRPLAWLAVDSTDTVTGRLLSYLEAAIARQVPAVEGVASAALAAQLPHPEVAGLLAEAVGDSNLLLVLDDVERLAEEPDALAVVASFARYLPSTARLVLISRSVLPFDAGAGASFLTYVAAVGEEDLAFTVQEASDALVLSGRPDVDPAEAIVETGGWVTGVLFEAWRSADHVIGIGGEADPLHGYLATQILAQLPPADREFLISTALLKEVTPAAAESLGAPDAGVRLHSLRSRRLPVAWDPARKAMRCHPRFREYLLELLHRRSDTDVKQLHLAYARLLLELQHDEEAVEEFFAAGRLDEALEVVERVVVAVIERTDFALAERWLQRLEPVRDLERTGLVVAELMLALAREDYGRGVKLADELSVAGRRDRLAAASSRAASLMAWCYLHAGRVTDIHAVLDIGCPGDELDAMRYAMQTVDDVTDPATPAGSLTGGPFDALVMRTHYDLGRLSLLAEAPSSPWAAKAGEPWRVGALLATGHTEQGFELYQGLEGVHELGVWLSAVMGPKLMAELGESDSAWRLLRAGRERVVASGSELFRMLSLLAEAELLLRLSDAPAGARRVLEEVARHPIGQHYANIREHANTLLGAALLREGEDLRARDRLLAAVEGMRRGGRILWLPAAAVHLAEAQWRLGEEQAADDAANLALWAAEQQGSNHLLLQALSDFPAVLSRRLDLERGADSPWHELGRALMVLGVDLGDVLAASVHVTEFGRTAVLVNGEDAALRLEKSHELLAYLANSGRDSIPRQELLDALFEGRGDDAAGSYLRQAVLRLRRAVPDVLRTDAAAGHVALGADVRVTTESERLSALLRQAASLRGQDRLRTLLQALEIADRGEYLPGVLSAWAEERRRHLASVVQEARHDAAEIAFATGHYRQAARLVGDVLRADPFRESAWRLQMRIADALGNPDRVIAAYRACERALAELGTQPAPTTVQLLRDLRR